MMYSIIVFISMVVTLVNLWLWYDADRLSKEARKSLIESQRTSDLAKAIVMARIHDEERNQDSDASGDKFLA